MGDVPLNGLVSPAFSHETLLPDDRRRRLALHLQRSELNQMIFDRTGDPRAGVSAHLTPTKRKKRMGIYFPLVFRADAESVSVCRHLCALCVKIAWSAQQQRGFATPRKESYAFQPT